jgi:tripartite-type tricarboxylate transporter receptor subunit TctC
MGMGRQGVVALVATLVIDGAIAGEVASPEPLSLSLSTPQAATTPCSGCFCASGCPGGNSVPLKLVVPGGIGAEVDVIGRILRLVAKENGGRQIELNNRSGAAITAASGSVAKAPPDGNTALLVTATTYAVNPHLYPAWSFDNDLEPVTALGEGPYILLIHPALPPRSVADLVAYAKANPRKVEFLSEGVGKLNHLAGELFNSIAGAGLLHTPYKTSDPAMADLSEGKGQLMMFARPRAAASHLKSAKVRALAVSTLRRSPQYPELPTVSESGLTGFYVVDWCGVAVPKGTPVREIQDLNAGLSALMSAQAERLKSTGWDPVSTTPGQFAEFMRSEYQRYGRLIKIAAVRVD